MAQAQAKKGDQSLTKKLRDYSVEYVKISEADMTYTRTLVKNYIEDQIMRYCRQNSTIPILRLEYTGSVYERLKTEAADEVDVMVVIKTTTSEVMVVNEQPGVPGYAKLVARPDSVFCKPEYASEGYINPERIRNRWFYSLVVQAVSQSPRSVVYMVVRAHGPAVQLDIFKTETREKLVSADLVPCFQIGPDSYYVTKPYSGRQHVSNPDLLWRQSFSLKEKGIVEYMDRDFGCRHELLRIVKTIVNKNPSSLGSLESYHLKTAFMHYIKGKRQNWAGPNSLGEHFDGFLLELQRFLENGKLPHYWLPGVNLLEDIKQTVIDKTADRLKRIRNSETEMKKILA